jgi:hypothetical protein
MRTSAASSTAHKTPSEPRISQHLRITPLLRQSGHDQEELDQRTANLLERLGASHSQDDSSHVVKASATESSSHVPIESPSVTSTTEVHGPSLLFADGDNTTCIANLGLALPRTEGAISAPWETVEVGGPSHIEAHCDVNGTSTTGVDATQLIMAEREMARVEVSTEMARVPSGSLDQAPTDSYPRGPYDPNMEAQVDMQVDLLIPLDEDEDESDSEFGVLSRTTFDPSLAYQPQLYNHGLSTEEDEPIIEDIGPGFVADAVMEDARTECWEADVSATAPKTLQPFSWVPPSLSGGFHTGFPGVPFAHAQMTAFTSTSADVFQHHTHNDTYTVDTTNYEETALQQIAPPQDIAWPFVSDGVQPWPSPSVEVGLTKEPQSVHATLSPTSVPSDFASQTTTRSYFLLPSPPPSKIDPVPVAPSTYRPIDGHKEGAKGLDGEVDPEPAVAASVQREVSTFRCGLISASM